MGSFGFIIIFLLLMLGGIYVTYRHEKKMWNNGICAKNGEKWVFFDMDSQGGRGYKAGDQIFWFTWDVDKDYEK